MRICFLDAVVTDYRADTPDTTPMGGTQSAACYLSTALAGLGHEVALWTKTSRPGVVHGVDCVNFHALPENARRDFDVVVLMSAVNAYAVELFRQWFPPQARFVLWIQHADDQPGPKGLEDPAVAGFWRAVALVSGWQARRYIDVFKLDPRRVHIMRNAAGPHFAGLFDPDEAIRPHKGDGALLAYASAPYRGLDLVIDAFPLVRRRVPEARLAVFAGPPAGDAGLATDPMLSRLSGMEGVVHVGSLPQRELAGRLKEAAVLMYPNTFAETSCVTVIEALAAGCRVVTSNLGALPETSAPFGVLRDPFDGDDRQAYLESFADAVANEIRFLRESAGAEVMLRRQVNMSRHNDWKARAYQWEHLFRCLIAEPA
jgi:glycosyltransferase involved in cell wall biosynthesis